MTHHLVAAASEPSSATYGSEIRRARWLEADCFWAWALIETLRLTGARIEEVLELTQLSLRHYTPPNHRHADAAAAHRPVQVDIERFIPMSPELVNVTPAVQRRTKTGGDTVPLSIRYDPIKKLHGDPLPHLFARRVGAPPGSPVLPLRPDHPERHRPSR